MNGDVAAFLPIAALIGLLLWWQRACRWAAPVAPLSICSAIILALVVAGAIGLLRPAAFVIGVSGLLLLARGGAWRRCGAKGDATGVSPVVIIMTGFYLLLWDRFVRVAPGEFRFPDEFALWALSVKDLVTTNALPTEGFVAGPQLAFYPCGSALFQYFHVMMTGYTEGHAYLAHNMLLVAVAACAVPAARGLRAIALGGVAASVVLLGCFAVVAAPFPTWPIPMRTLYLDAHLGGFMGVAIGWYFVNQGRKAKALAQVSPVLLAIPLLKPYGWLFTDFAVLCIVAVNVPVWFRLRRHTGGSAHVTCFRRRMRRHLLACAAIAVAAPVVFQVWLLFAPQSRALAERTRGVSLSAMLHSIRHERPVLTSRLHEFSGALTHTQVNTWTTLAPLALLQAAKVLPDTAEPVKFEVRLPAMCLVLSFVFAVSVLIFSRKKRGAMQGAALGFAMALGFCAYTLFLCLVYLFVKMPWGERLSLHSYDRYWSSYLFSVVVVSAIVLSATAQRARGMRARLAVGALLLMLVAGLVNGGFAWSVFRNGAGSIPERSRIRAAVALVQPACTAKCRVFVVDRKPMYFRPLMYQYEMLPDKITDRWVWGVPVAREGVVNISTQPDNAENGWKSTADAWGQTLKDFQFVIVGEVDDAFWSQYKDLFACPDTAKESRVFKVLPRGDGVELRPLGLP